VCVLPLSDSDATMTQLFIPVRGREGPTSSEGGDFVLSYT